MKFKKDFLKIKNPETGEWEAIPALQGEKGADGKDGKDGKDGLTTSIKINGETYTQDNGTIELPDIKGNCKVAYGTCSTEAAIAEKAIVIEDPNWKLEVGSIVTIRFAATNTASNVTLNVNNTGAYGIGASTSSPYTSTSSTYTGYANRAFTYMFDGTYWQWISGGVYPSSATNVSLGQGYTTCSTAAATKAKTASLSSYTLSTGGIVVVKFTNDVPAGATLNVNSKGAKAIYYKGVAITDGVIKAGDTATFIYSTRYHLISIDREIPTKTSQLTNDSGFLTQIPSEYVTETELNNKGYLTEHQDISNKVDKVSGKGLSTNDYTTSEKNKLAGIEAGANKVTVYTAKECTSFTSDKGTCTPLAVQKAVGLFPPKAHEHSQYLTKHQGSENAGKILAVDNNGDIVFEEMPEGSGEGGTKSELLEFTYVSTYPNQKSFEYTTTTGPGGYWLYKKSTLLGGILSVDWDTAL